MSPFPPHMTSASLIELPTFPGFVQRGVYNVYFQPIQSPRSARRVGRGQETVSDEIGGFSLDQQVAASPRQRICASQQPPTFFPGRLTGVSGRPLYPRGRKYSQYEAPDFLPMTVPLPSNHGRR